MPDNDVDIDLDNAYTEPDNVDSEVKPESSVYVDTETDSHRETRPRALAKRESTEQLVSLVWGGVGAALIHSGTDIPVGRCLALQAPMAGKQIDALIAGTFVDRALQPLVGAANKAEGLGALFALPAMVALYERNASLAPVLEPLLKEVVSATLVELAPAMKARKRKETAAAKTISELNESFGLKKGEDPVLAILNTLFAAPEGMEQPNAETEEG